MYLGEKSLATCINYCDTAITVSYKYSFCRIAQVRSQWVTKYITCTEEIHFFFWKTISFLLSQIDQHHACILYSGALTPQPIHHLLLLIHCTRQHTRTPAKCTNFLPIRTDKRPKRPNQKVIPLATHKKKKRKSLTTCVMPPPRILSRAFRVDHITFSVHDCMPRNFIITHFWYHY